MRGSPMMEMLEERRLMSDVLGSMGMSSVLSPSPEPISAPLMSPSKLFGQRTVSDTTTVSRGAWKYYGAFVVAAGGQITATITGDGDADLYVRRAAAPTLTLYDCRPYTGLSNESCTLSGAGTYYVGVNGYAASSNFHISIAYDAA